MATTNTSAPARVTCFIDGLNLYYRIKDLKKPHYLWLDVGRLAKRFLAKNEVLEKLIYYNSKPVSNPDGGNIKRYNTYKRALSSRGYKVVEGKFKMKGVGLKNPQSVTLANDKKINDAKSAYGRVPEEKETDVNIAVDLLDMAYREYFDTAFLITSDADIIPAVKRVLDNFPHKKIMVLRPHTLLTRGEKGERKRGEYDQYKKISNGYSGRLKLHGLRENHIQDSLFDSVIIDTDGKKIKCPLQYMTCSSSP